MKINLEIDIKPFDVPGKVIVEQPTRQRQDGFNPLPTLPLSDLEAEVLLKMCDDFKEEVFKLAKKMPPPTTCDCAR